MTAIKLKRGTFQHIESELYAYHDTCEEILRLKNEILHGKGNDDENIGGGRSGNISDPTARTAVLLTSHRRLEQLQNIANAIQTVYDQLPPEKQQLLRIRYWTKPQTLTWDGIANKLNVSRRTALNWRDEVVYAVSYKIGWS